MRRAGDRTARNDRLSVFALNATGNVAPIRTLIDGPNSNLFQVRDMIVDTAHNELITVSINNRISVFSRTASGDPVPTRVITGVNTKISNAISIAFNPVADELFVDSYDVACANLPGILVFNRTDSGNVAPKQNLTGSSTTITSMGGIIVDSVNNRLIAANQAPSANAILAFARTASGNTAPLVTVAGPSTGLATPFGLALDLTGGLTATALVATIPTLDWEGLTALVLILSLVGFVAIRRLT